MLELKVPKRQATIGLRGHYNGKPEHSSSLEIFISEKDNQSVLFIYLFIFAVALRPNAGYGLLILEVSRSHTTHHSR